MIAVSKSIVSTMMPRSISPKELAVRISSNSEQPILVDVWGPGCAPCKALASVIKRLAESALAQWQVYSINAEAYPDWAQEHGIRHLPTLMLYKEGQLVTQESGIITEGQLLRFIEPSAHQEQALLQELLLLEQQDTTQLSFRLDQLSDADCRDPAIQQIISRLKIGELPISPELESLRSELLKLIHAAKWDDAWAFFFTALQQCENNAELRTFGHALIDIVPDRRLAQRWRLTLQKR